MSESYTVAIIGTGGIANTHAGYYTASDRTEMVAGCDIDEERLNAFCDKHDIEHRYLDYETLLDEVEPEMVSVCTWNGTHMPISIAAIEAGAKAVVSEKPMSDELGGPLDAVALAEERGCHFVVHHQRRFAPGYNAAKRLIAEGALGETVSARMASGGGLLNIGSHLIDGCRWVLSDPGWTAVVGWIQRNTNRFERGSYAEEKTHALVEVEGGHEMTLSVDMVDLQKQRGFQVCGPAGVINIDRDQAVLIDAAGAHEPEADPQPGYLEELLAWMDGGPPHRNIASEALVAQQIMMAIYESARSRTRVEPPYEKRESPLEQMIHAGELPAEGESYDIRIEEALEWAMKQRGEV
ncbi:MAG: Gfo/Idh/MocA family oxidoreductase [Armatimonadota bacterium]|nr:Gfo/Idh/MocA family oxidoreductase [Armatimonadota bacterium]